MLFVLTFHAWCIQNDFLLSLSLCLLIGALCDFRIILPTLTTLQRDLMIGWELVEMTKLGRSIEWGKISK